MQELIVLDPKHKELIPDILKYTGLQDSPADLKELTLITVDNFDSDNLLNLKIIIEAWVLNPKLLES